MQCPVCATDLVFADRQGVEVRYCPHCRGLWLDNGQLEDIVERSWLYITRKQKTLKRNKPRLYVDEYEDELFDVEYDFRRKKDKKRRVKELF